MTAVRARGFNLPELMVSMAIGLVLLAAFIKVLDRCRSDFAVNESLARLQDAARHALSVLVPDLEHAGFYGVTSTPRVRLMRDGNVMVVLLPPMEGSRPRPARHRARPGSRPREPPGNGSVKRQSGTRCSDSISW